MLFKSSPGVAGAPVHHPGWTGEGAAHMLCTSASRSLLP